MNGFVEKDRGKGLESLFTTVTLRNELLHSNTKN